MMSDRFYQLMTMRLLAEDIAGYFLLKFPRTHWTNWIKEAVAALVSYGYAFDEADRALRAAIFREVGHEERKQVRG